MGVSHTYHILFGLKNVERSAFARSNPGFFTGHDPGPWVVSGGFPNLAGRVGSGQECVRSLMGRVGSP